MESKLGPLGTSAILILAYCTCPGWLWGWRIWWNKWQGKPKYSEKTCPAPLCPPQIPLDQTRDWTRAAAHRSLLAMPNQRQAYTAEIHWNALDTQVRQEHKHNTSAQLERSSNNNNNNNKTNSNNNAPNRRNNINAESKQCRCTSVWFQELPSPKGSPQQEKCIMCDNLIPEMASAYRWGVESGNLVYPSMFGHVTWARYQMSHSFPSSRGSSTCPWYIRIVEIGKTLVLLTVACCEEIGCYWMT
jgi:hypothetical protein